MADLKISQLTAITTLTPATDVLPVVDVTGTTKKITTNQLLGSGGTATLASATITGNLTVDTNTLFVDSSNNYVGVGTATPLAQFFSNLNATGVAGRLNTNTIGSAIAASYQTGGITNGTLPFGIRCTGNSFTGISGQLYASQIVTESTTALALEIFNTGNTPIVFGVNGAESMRLNSTGLGVGVTPSAGRGAIQLSAGVGFPATQVASSDANTLDDYKEGSWTPTLNAGTFSSASCRYTKVGNIVTIFFDVTVGTGGGSQITNLPYTAAATSTVANGIYTNNQAYVAGTTAPVVVIGGSSTTLFFRTVGTGVAFSAMTFTAGANLTGSISYFV